MSTRSIPTVRRAPLVGMWIIVSLASVYVIFGWYPGAVKESSAHVRKVTATVVSAPVVVLIHDDNPSATRQYYTTILAYTNWSGRPQTIERHLLDLKKAGAQVEIQINDEGTAWLPRQYEYGNSLYEEARLAVFVKCSFIVFLCFGFAIAITFGVAMAVASGALHM